MAKRRKENDLWECQKDTIHHLYIAENKTLDVVVKIMASKHNFERTNVQYERIFRKWGWTKHVTANTWRSVGHKVEKRAAKGKTSELRINGVLVSEAKLRRELSRYDFGTAFAFANPQTPPGILVSTPPSSTDDLMLDSSPAPCPKPFSLEDLVVLAQTTPWKLFHDFMEKFYHSYSAPILIMSSSSNSSNGPWREYSPSPSNLMQELLNELLMFMYTQETPGPYDPFTLYLNPKSFVPLLRLDSTEQIPFKIDGDLTRRSTQLEWLKMAVFCISNNMADKTLIFAFIELCQDKTNQRLLRKLLSEKTLSVDAFAEKLLTPAVSVGGMSLVTLLLYAGVSPDAKGLYHDGLWPCSPLQCSILQRKTEVTKILLDHGANPYCFDFISGKHYTFARSNSDLAVLSGIPTMVDEVMRPRTPFGHFYPPVTLVSIALIIINNDISMLHFILRRNPHLVQSLIDESARALELAAIYGYIGMIDALMAYGVNVNKTDSKGTGSALAAAACGGHLPAVHHLLSLGSNINGISTWKGWDPIYQIMSYRVGRIPLHGGLSPLSFACLGSYEDIFWLLLERGADIDLSLVPKIGFRLPTTLQLAVGSGTKNMVHALLQAGANPNHHPCDLPTDDFNTGGLEQKFHDRTALQLAIERGDYEITQLLTQHGAILHPVGAMEMNMENFILALEDKNTTIIELFFESGLKFNDKDTALQACLEYNQFDVAIRILGTGYIPQSPGPLCAAVYLRNLELVHVLLDKAAFHEDFPKFAASGLAMAARIGNTELIKFFLDADAKPYTEALGVQSVRMHHKTWDPDLEIPNGTCAIEELAKVVKFHEIGGIERHITAAELLLNFYAKRDEMNNSSQLTKIQNTLDKALLSAVAANNTPIVRLLLGSGADASAQHENGATCFNYATLRLDGKSLDRASYELVELLLEYGADPNITCREANAYEHEWPRTEIASRIYCGHDFLGPQNNTPLQNAAETNRIDLVQLLLQHGADANAAPQQDEGATALQYAALNSNFEIVNLLLQAGADVNADRACYEGRTALEGAAEHGRLDMVRYLLTLGADVKCKNNGQYKRAVYRAWKGGHMTIVRMLQDYKADKYGPDDCDSVKHIVDTMTFHELEIGNYYV